MVPARNHWSGLWLFLWLDAQPAMDMFYIPNMLHQCQAKYHEHMNQVTTDKLRITVQGSVIIIHEKPAIYRNPNDSQTVLDKKLDSCQCHSVSRKQGKKIVTMCKNVNNTTSNMQQFLTGIHHSSWTWEMVPDVDKMTSLCWQLMFDVDLSESWYAINFILSH